MITCKTCEAPYQGRNNLYCSRVCRNRDPELIRRVSELRRGRVASELSKSKQSLAARKSWQQTDRANGVWEEASHWKGDAVKYSGLHRWIRRWMGRPCRCEFCGLQDSEHPRRFQWANKSHEYKRDFDDWLRLCVKCHKDYDKAYREGTSYGL